MYRTTIYLSEHEEKAMDLLVRETIFYHNFDRCLATISQKERLTPEQEELLSVAILKCALAMQAVGDIMYLIKMRQWCDSQDNLLLILNIYRVKFLKELSKTADKVTLFKSYFEAFEREAECLNIESLDYSLFYRRYEELEIEAIFAQPREGTVFQNENFDILTKNSEISSTESQKTLKIHPDNIFCGNESVLMDRRRPASLKAMELLLEEAVLYDGYEQCMDSFSVNLNLTWEQKKLVSEVYCRKFNSAFFAVANLMYEVEIGKWCDKLDNLFVIINDLRTEADKELSKLADKVTQLGNFVEVFKKEAKSLRGSYLYPHKEYFQIKVAIVKSRLHRASQKQNPDISTKKYCGCGDGHVLDDDNDDYEEIFTY